MIGVKGRSTYIGYQYDAFLWNDDDSSLTFFIGQIYRKMNDQLNFSGTLARTATAGSITQGVNGKVSATGATTLAAGQDITLSNANNNFTGAVGATGESITLNGTNSIVLGTVQADELNLTASTAITQTDTGLISAKKATLTAGGDIGTASKKVNTNAEEPELLSNGDGIYVQNTAPAALRLTANGEDSTINIESTGDLNLVKVSANYGTGTAQLTSSGSVLKDTTATQGVIIESSNVTIEAGGTFGTEGNAIKTEAFDSLNVTTAGNAFIDNKGDVKELDVKTTSGAIKIDNDGDIGLGVINAGANDIEINAVGKISDANDTTLNITGGSL